MHYIHYTIICILYVYIFYILLALTRKICGILSKKLQKLALFKYSCRTCLSKQLYFAVFLQLFRYPTKFARLR